MHRESVLVVDDHPMVRRGLRSMLTGPDVEIVGEAGTGAEAVHEAAERSPDIVLLDMKLPDLDGLAVLAGVRRAAPGAHARSAADVEALTPLEEDERATHF